MFQRCIGKIRRNKSKPDVGYSIQTLLIWYSGLVYSAAKRHRAKKTKHLRLSKLQCAQYLWSLSFQVFQRTEWMFLHRGLVSETCCTVVQWNVSVKRLCTDVYDQIYTYCFTVCAIHISNTNNLVIIWSLIFWFQSHVTSNRLVLRWQKSPQLWHYLIIPEKVVLY